MDTNRAIQIAVARADLILTAILRAVPAVIALTVILVALVIVARARWPDPCRINYDAPGVDITSEGPEGYTEAWHEWSEDQ